MFTKILEFDVFNENIDSLMDYVLKREKSNIISGNPEVLFNGLNDENLLKSFKDKDSVIIPDGVGTVLAAKMVKNPVQEKVAGIDVVKRVIEEADKRGKSVYFLGAKEEVVQKCVENIKKQYPELKIAGYHNGFFDLNNCDEIIKEIQENRPWAIFAAMGSPRQEIFIEKIKDITDIKIYMGVGGVFDIFAGNLKRAPKWMISLGLEWLYRVIKEPFRIKRLGAIPKFLWLVKKNKNYSEKKTEPVKNE